MVVCHSVNNKLWLSQLQWLDMLAEQGLHTLPSTLCD